MLLELLKCIAAGKLATWIDKQKCALAMLNDTEKKYVNYF